MSTFFEGYFPGPVASIGTAIGTVVAKGIIDAANFAANFAINCVGDLLACASDIGTAIDDGLAEIAVREW